MKIFPLLAFCLLAFRFASSSSGAEPADSPSAEPNPPEVALDFGSDEPARRTDIPERGQIEIPGGGKMEAMGHWDQYDWTAKTPRWGNYEVLLTYGLKMNSLGVQLKLGEERLKTRLPAASFEEPNTVSLGTLYFSTAGEHALNLYTPPVERLGGIDFKGLRLIPALGGRRGEQAEDGTIQLLAKNATTWSTNLRYEPKPEKNCLGFWTEVEDWAEWEFEVEKGGEFEVEVYQGCGGKNGGSEVEVSVGDQKHTFTVVQTGGFQDFKPVPAGKFELADAGIYRLAIRPKTKAGSAIMDVQKVILKPVAE